MAREIVLETDGRGILHVHTVAGQRWYTSSDVGLYANDVGHVRVSDGTCSVRPASCESSGFIYSSIAAFLMIQCMTLQSVASPPICWWLMILGLCSQDMALLEGTPRTKSQNDGLPHGLCYYKYL